MGEARYAYRIAGFIGIAGDGVLEFRTPFEKPLGLFVISQEDTYLIRSRFAPVIPACYRTSEAKGLFLKNLMLPAQLRA